jgi:hypothetical protein
MNGTKIVICLKGQIFEFCRAKQAVKREQDLTNR